MSVSPNPDTTVTGTAQAPPQFRISRYFSRPGTHPFDEIEWDIRTATIANEKGETVFEQRDVEVPRSWSQLATNVVVSKYFHGPKGSPQRERSARQLVTRVVDTITEWGDKDGYFLDEEERETFRAELTAILINQRASFNSPVWFNIGVPGARPQASACFINSVRDEMESILDLAKTEGMLFKWGSGTGTNLSPIRSSREALSSGGTASGPVSFMRGYDTFAGSIKSGGKTRRAAKMVILNIDHPDIREFILCKVEEEKKARILIEAGYDPGFNVPGGAYDSVHFQNANNSVRVTDEFMRAVENDGEWQTHAVVGGRVMDTYRARDLMQWIAESAHMCGDPGIQYDTTINNWHTCPNTDRIHASNPCVTGDTLVATSDGWQRIDALVGKTVRVIGADGQPHFVTRVFPTGKKSVFRLRTKAGYEVRITGDHKVLTAEHGDVPVNALQAGERIVLQGAGFGRTALSENLALALGVAVGDGCLTRSTIRGNVEEIVTIVMAQNERGILERIAGEVNQQKKMLRAVGDVGNPGMVSVSTMARPVSRLAFASQPVVDLFKKYTVLDEGSDRKRFLPSVFELDRPSQAAILRGLFTADGTVANYGDKSQYVSLDSTSSELVRQVQLLLLSFGIKTKIYSGRRGGVAEAELPDGRGNTRVFAVKEMYSLRISRSSRIIFEREIGFDPASPKADQLAALNEQFAAYHDDLTDEVALVESLGDEDVYDLTEEVTHHFVANGLVVHNCSEYMFLNDSACNLASLNLMAFRDENGEFDIRAFRHAIRVVITAQEILVGNASYPTPAIERNSHDYRPLGLGYANLGALLMARGLPYDSDEGRAYAGAVTALMTGEAYRTSAHLAARKGPFAGFAANREAMLGVIRKHGDHVQRIDRGHVPEPLFRAAETSWREAYELGEQHGFRNAQATVLAPTGTIGFMMDCDTTGIEPDMALVKYKKLVGGGALKIVNTTVPLALATLGYTETEIRQIIEYIDKNDTIEGAPFIKDEHLPVFDCAFKPVKGTRSIHYMGHVRMMSAVQPFISGAISKTVNMPETATVEEVRETYMQGWKLGLKAIAIYRDNCKSTQPVSTKKTESAAPAEPEWKPRRRRLPDERNAMTHKFSIAGHEGYITVGMYEDGQPGEIFIVMSKVGSTIAGLMDAFATMVSLALQYGVPLKVLADKFSHSRFEPAGFTNNPQIPMAKSIMDYIFRWLALKFLPQEERPANGDNGHNGDKPPIAEDLSASAIEMKRKAAIEAAEKAVFVQQGDAPLCTDCGSIMIRSGACYKCLNCGSTSGCS
ncbi:MAG TPA: LAGLIDADG family homing endonuclease [Candidatus Latescibacteria bacterium]|nr:LAGLIDADG family homing endonuclease [Candidatus Latescibacterota bacterium]